MIPERWTRRKSPQTNAYRALVSSAAPSVSPRCHSAYSSHECDFRNLFSSSVRGCTSPQSLSSTYWRALMSRRAWATARLLSLYLGIHPLWDDSARQRLGARPAARPGRLGGLYVDETGRMFWLTLKTLSGSQRALSAASRP